MVSITYSEKKLSAVYRSNFLEMFSKKCVRRAKQIFAKSDLF